MRNTVSPVSASPAISTIAFRCRCSSCSWRRSSNGLFSCKRVISFRDRSRIRMSARHDDSSPLFPSDPSSESRRFNPISFISRKRFSVKFNVCRLSREQSEFTGNACTLLSTISNVCSSRRPRKESGASSRKRLAPHTELKVCTVSFLSSRSGWKAPSGIRNTLQPCTCSSCKLVKRCQLCALKLLSK